VTLADFGLKPKKAYFRPKTSSREKRPKEALLTGSKNNNHKPDRDKCIGSFEPSEKWGRKMGSDLFFRKMGSDLFF